MANTPYERLTTAAEEASNNPADVHWVQLAFATLASNYVKSVTSESALQKVIGQLAETGESAEDLYGTPEQWAYSKIADWKEKGTQAFVSDEPWTLKEIVVAGLFTGAFASLLFWVISILPSDRPAHQTLGLYLLPGVLGMFVVITGVTFQGSRKKMGFTAATLLTALAILGGAVATAGGLFASYELYNQRFPVWTHLIVALGLGVLGTAAGFLLPSARPKADADNQEDYQDAEAWLKRFKQELWNRGDISDARVREEVARVQEFTAESGQSYREEFGHPAAYAHSLSPQKVVKPHRLYLHSLLMVCCLIYWGYGIITTNDTVSQSWRLPLLIAVSCLVVLELRKNYRAYRQAKAQSSSF